MKPKIEWIKNDKKEFNTFEDGSVFLVALQVTNTATKKKAWEFDVIEFDCDGDGASLRYRGGGDHYDSWEWNDFEYFQLLEGTMPSYSTEYDFTEQATPAEGVK